MYKLFYFIGFLSLLLVITSCGSNEWEIRTTIEPKILYLDSKNRNFSIQYQLGPYLILDDIDVLNVSYREYIKQSVDTKLNLYVRYDSSRGDNGFYYFFDNIRLHRYPTEPISLMKLQKRQDEIPGFKWLKTDADISESENIKLKEAINPTKSLKRM